VKSSLLVCSKSTRKFLPEYDEVRIVSGPPTIKILEEEGSVEHVVAIGGGAVIDTAKILSRTPISCYPTTASGSTATSWGVYWDGENKHSCYRQKPNSIMYVPSFMDGMPNEIIVNTICDAVSHCLDSLNSVNSTDDSEFYCRHALSLLEKKEDRNCLLEAGHVAGLAIEITSTNLLHCLSYPMTGRYGIPHGKALGILLPKLSKFMGHDVNDIIHDCSVDKNIEIDYEFIVDNALKYDKIKQSKLEINKIELMEMLTT
jgi:alcohol dehydrogenase class IV